MVIPNKRQRNTVDQSKLWSMAAGYFMTKARCFVWNKFHVLVLLYSWYIDGVRRCCHNWKYCNLFLIIVVMFCYWRDLLRVCIKNAVDSEHVKVSVLMWVVLVAFQWETGLLCISRIKSQLVYLLHFFKYTLMWLILQKLQTQQSLVNAVN
jgi:hypothetical protein